MAEFLLIAFLFLIAGVVAVPLATRFGLGSVLGYLLAGIAIAPMLGWAGVDVASLQQVAEFGVIMMLFLVGLELEPKRLWQMRGQLLGLGGLQVVLTVLLVMAAGMVLGLAWAPALAVGCVVSLSSTAIVLQTLGEKGLMRSDGGQASFAVLLFQDIAVIPMLAILPLLALPGVAEMAIGEAASGGEAAADMNVAATLPGYAQALVTLGAIAVVVVGGTYLTRPVFRFIAQARLRELFTATALMIVVGIALLMMLVGLSSALGTFLAGVVLANSEYRHEIEADIDPFKGLFLGLFFMTVGAAFDFNLLGEQFGTVLGLTLGLIAIKAGVIYALGLLFGVPGPDRWLFALGLSQAGEFAFVLLSFTTANNVLPDALADQLLLVVALSMALTPALYILHERVIAPRYRSGDGPPPDDMPDEPRRVIIAGHGRFGGIVNRMLLGRGIRAVVLDHSSQQLDLLRTFGVEIFFGDATRPDLLAAAGIAQAELLVIAIDDPGQTTELVSYVRRTYPQVKVVARARDRAHVYELYAAGAREIVRESFDSSVRAGRTALECLGAHPYEAERYARKFTVKDRAALASVAALHDPTVPIEKNTAYVARSREVMAELQTALQSFSTTMSGSAETDWAPPKPDDVAANTSDSPEPSDAEK